VEAVKLNGRNVVGLDVNICVCVGSSLSELGVNMAGRCTVDKNNDCGDGDYSMGFAHSIEGKRNHVGCAQLVG